MPFGRSECGWADLDQTFSGDSQAQLGATSGFRQHRSFPTVRGLICHRAQSFASRPGTEEVITRWHFECRGFTGSQMSGERSVHIERHRTTLRLEAFVTGNHDGAAGGVA